MSSKKGKIQEAIDKNAWTKKSILMGMVKIDDDAKRCDRSFIVFGYAKQQRNSLVH